MNFKLRDEILTTLKKLKDDEFAELLQIIQNEQDNRALAKRTRAWEKVISAIADYSKIYGDICIFDEMYVGASDNYNEIGEIR